MRPPAAAPLVRPVSPAGGHNPKNVGYDELADRTLPVESFNGQQVACAAASSGAIDGIRGLGALELRELPVGLDNLSKKSPYSSRLRNHPPFAPFEHMIRPGQSDLPYSSRVTFLWRNRHDMFASPIDLQTLIGMRCCMTSFAVVRRYRTPTAPFTT